MGKKKRGHGSGQQSQSQQGQSQQGQSQQSPRQQSTRQQSPHQQSPRQQSPHQQSPRQQSPHQQSPRQQPRGQQRQGNAPQQQGPQGAWASRGVSPQQQQLSSPTSRGLVQSPQPSCWGHRSPQYQQPQSPQAMSPVQSPRQGAWGQSRGSPQPQSPVQLERGSPQQYRQQSGWVSPQATSPQQQPQSYDDLSRQEGTSTATQQPVSTEASRAILEGLSISDKPKSESKYIRKMKGEVIQTIKKGISKQGNSGKPITLQANYFKLTSTANWNLYQHAVSFAPDVDLMRERKYLFYRYGAKGRPYLFDGAVLFSTVSFNDEKICCKRTNANDSYMEIKFTKMLDRYEYQYLQVFNLIMRKCYEQLNMTLIGRNYYISGEKTRIPEHSIELWPGYISTIRQHENNILMNVDIVHRVLQENTVWFRLKKFRSPNGTFSQENQNAARNLFVGVIVFVHYNNRSYRIHDIDFQVTPDNTFDKKGEMISYRQYYKNKYNIIINDRSQPLLAVLKTDKSSREKKEEVLYLVPELCYSTGISSEMRGNFRLMKTLATHCNVNPGERIQKLLDFNSRIQSNPKSVEELSQWNMKLESNLVQINARVLPDEIISAHSTSLQITNYDWMSHLRRTKMYRPTDIKNWVIIFRQEKRVSVDVFVDQMKRVGRGVGNYISDPMLVPLNNNPQPSDYCYAIEKLLSKSSYQIVFCIVRTSDINLYSAIKRKCSVDRGVPSQVFLENNIDKQSLSVTTKICVQVTCKLGGTPWILKKLVSDLMVVGFDVCHAANRSASVRVDYGAMVASIDENCIEYYSKVSEHSNNEEISNNFASNLGQAVNEYAKKNRKLPRYIMIYRDGVGDGDVVYVNEFEIQAIRRMLIKVYKSEDKVKFAFILVTKRINTRLFMNGNRNPPPGTIVDTVITHPMKYDFYLVSQNCTNGTVTPTAYHVLYSNLTLTPDQIQQITYKLTYGYYNWTGPIRVPAPCQYAHKLALICSKALKTAPSNRLECNLHYL